MPRTPDLPQPLRIALVNDHPLVVEGLRSLLRGHQEVQVVELDSELPTVEPVDLALLDTHALSQPLAVAVKDRLASGSVRRVAVFTWQVDEQLVADALEAGAAGVLSKSLGAEELVDSLLRLAGDERLTRPHAGSTTDDLAASEAGCRDWPGRQAGLSMREAEMITLVCQGLTNEQIAELLYLSPNSIKSYIRTAYQKIGVTSRSQAVIWGIDHQMRPSPSRRTADAGTSARS